MVKDQVMNQRAVKTWIIKPRVIMTSTKSPYIENFVEGFEKTKICHKTSNIHSSVATCILNEKGVGPLIPVMIVVPKVKYDVPLV